MYSPFCAITIGVLLLGIVEALSVDVHVPGVERDLQAALHAHIFKIISTFPVKTNVQPPARQAPLSSANYLSAGYVYVQLSNGKTDTQCEKNGVTAGVPVNTCIASDSSSYKVQLQTDGCSGATVELFSDATCSTLESSVPLEDMADQCNPYEGEQDVSMGQMTLTVPLYFWQIKCTAQPTKPIPVASAVVELYEDAGSCDNYLGYASISPDLCLPINKGLASVAVKCTKSGGVRLVQYFGGACGFSIGNTAYTTDTCSAVSSAIAMRHQKPADTSVAPVEGKTVVSQALAPVDPTPQGVTPVAKHPNALKPITTEPQALHPIETSPQALRPVNPEPQAVSERSQMVSSAEIIGALPDAASMANSDVSSYIITCAQPNTNYAAIISVSQVLEGINYASFIANGDKALLALQKSIAASLSASSSVSSAGGVAFSDIFISSVLPVTPGGGSKQGQRMLTGGQDALSVLYTVLSYRPTLSNTKLGAALERAVDSGAFTALLHQFASSEGATALAQASSDSLSVNSLNTGSGDTGGDNDEEGDDASHPQSSSDRASRDLSGGALVGVIVGGCAVVVLLCAFMAYYCLYTWPAHKSEAVPAAAEQSVPASAYGTVDHRPYHATVASAPPAVEMVSTHDVRLDV